MTVDYRKYPVLYVDDEPENLLTFRYALGEQFRVVTAGSGSEALDVLSRQDVAVLLCDQRMPGMTGVEVCRRAREIRPDTVRIIVTAYADLDAAIGAINLGQVARYLKKPWRNEELADVLMGSIDIVRLQRTVRDLQARILAGGDARVIEALNHQIAGALQGPVSRLDINVEQVGDLLDAGLDAWDARPRARDLVEHARAAQAEAEPAVAELRDMVQRLRRLQRIEAPPSVVECDAARVIQATVEVVRPLLHPDVRVEVHATAGRSVPMDPAALGQVIVNLVTNASAAMVDRPATDRVVTITLEDEPDLRCLTVGDRGAGIGDLDPDRIFDAHYTTRPGAPGNGLAVVRHLVTESGGEVRVARSDARGTEIKLSWPPPEGVQGRHPTG